MSSDGENNSSQQENITTWKLAKSGLYTIRAKSKWYWSITLISVLPTCRGLTLEAIVLGNDADFVDMQPDNPLQISNNPPRLLLRLSTIQKVAHI